MKIVNKVPLADRTMIIRIFLPQSVYYLQNITNSKNYYIYGRIASDAGGNVSVYIIDIHEAESVAKPIAPLVGKIASKTSDTKHLPSDCVIFGISSNEIELRTIQLPNFAPAGSSFQTQLLLYDSKQFTELSQMCDEHKLSLRLDSISQLLLIIKNEGGESTNRERLDGAKGAITTNRLILYLMTLATFTQTKFSFVNSAFLKHFQFWTLNLAKRTHKR